MTAATNTAAVPGHAERVALAEVVGCFRAAQIEGLEEALLDTTDERLKDLVERRLMYALYAAQPFAPRTFEDGDSICAVWHDFIDLQQSPAGFGETVAEAIENLCVAPAQPAAAPLSEGLRTILSDVASAPTYTDDEMACERCVFCNLNTSKGHSAQCAVPAAQALLAAAPGTEAAPVEQDAVREQLVALQAKCDLLSASLKQADAVRDGLVAALKLAEEALANSQPYEVAFTDPNKRHNAALAAVTTALTAAGEKP